MDASVRGAAGIGMATRPPRPAAAAAAAAAASGAPLALQARVAAAPAARMRRLGGPMPRWHPVRALPAPADLIEWPEGTKPKRGSISKAALLKLKPGETPEQRAARVAANTVAAGSGMAPEAGLEVCRASGVEPEALPPFPPGLRGVSYMAHKLRLEPEEMEMVLSNNRTAMMLTFLGTSGETTGTSRAAPCAALLRGKDVWLFDAGEDTQRQVSAHPYMRPSKIFRIFVSSLRAERVLGLPGLICTVGSARERGHENADIPVHVYGPPGTAEFLACVYQVSSTYVEMPIVVHEFTPSPAGDAEPQLFNRRAKIWRQALPPDQLNPDGFVDGDLASFMPTLGRATRAKGSRAAGGPLKTDERAGYLPLPLPPRGDPSAKLAPQDMAWSIAADPSAMVQAVLLDAESPPVFGFVVREADRTGGISMARCKALKVPP
ncbi:MAG: hypothetical protein J3K34DRAFT_461521, partial [Monoraphidium minutum]